MEVSELRLWWDILSKAEKAWAKNYGGVMCNDTEEWQKIWGGINLSYQNWHKEFDLSTWAKNDMTWAIWKIFTPEHSKASNLELWWDSFIKAENVLAYNLQGSYVSWQLMMMQNLKRNWLVSSKLTWKI